MAENLAPLTRATARQAGKLNCKPRPALGELGNQLQLNQQRVKNAAVTAALKAKPAVTAKPAVVVDKKIMCRRPLRTNVETRQLDQLKEKLPKTRVNPLQVTEYVYDIFSYMKSLEWQHKVEHRYLLEHQTTPHMRRILVNWMCEVNGDFGMLSETYHLGIILLDRFLQKDKSIGESTLQLAGCAALFVASKVEEVAAICASDMLYLCDNAYTLKELLSMERRLLQAVQFEVGTPTSLHFLRRFSKVASVSSTIYSFGKYALELCTLDHVCSEARPSLLAAAAICLGLSIFNNLRPRQAWSDALCRNALLAYEDLRPIVLKIVDLVSSVPSSKYNFVYKKYSDLKQQKISKYPALEPATIMNNFNEKNI